MQLRVIPSGFGRNDHSTQGLLATLRHGRGLELYGALLDFQG